MGAGMWGRIDTSSIVVKEVSAYGVVGVVNFLLDLGVYQVMYAEMHQGALVSKVVSTFVTTVLAYFMHKHWSFSHRQGLDKLHHEFTVFFALSVVTLLLGLGLIGAVRYGAGNTNVIALQTANVASIVLGVIFRFWGYRRWVFVD